MEKTGLKPTDQIVYKAMQGDGLAFTELWDTYIVRLRLYIKSWIKNRDDLYVDDICSRSFEKAFRQIGNFDPQKSQFFTWLRVIAHNTALDLEEQEKRLHPSNQIVYLDDSSKSVSMVENIPDSIDTPLDSIIRTEDEEARSGYIDALPELYREVARKRMLDGLQYSEIASQMGLELNTVRTRIRRAKSLIDKMHREREEE